MLNEQKLKDIQNAIAANDLKTALRWLVEAVAAEQLSEAISANDARIAALEAPAA